MYATSWRRSETASYPPRLRHALNRLSGSALNLFRSHVPEKSPSTPLDLLRQAFDDPYRTRTTAREIRRLRQKNQTLGAYLVDFARVMGDLHWTEAAREENLYEGSRRELRIP